MYSSEKRSSIPFIPLLPRQVVFIVFIKCLVNGAELARALHAYYFDGVFLELLLQLFDDALADFVLLALAVDLPT